MSGESVIIKGISLWEPWATLSMLGVKTYETRSWYTSYRGPLLICAAQKKVSFRFVDVLLEMNHFWEDMGKIGFEKPEGYNDFSDRQCAKVWKNLLDGYMLCGYATVLVDLTECIRTEDIRSSLSVREHSYGDYSPGRFAWRLENKKVIYPFPVTGKQGLFDIEIDKKLLETNSTVE